MSHSHCGGPVAELHHGDDEIVFDIADVCGPATWSAIHHLAENFPCGPCAEEGASLMRFAHDLINVKLGRPLMYPDDFRTWSTTVFETAASLGESDAINPGDRVGALGQCDADALCVAQTGCEVS